MISCWCWKCLLHLLLKTKISNVSKIHFCSCLVFPLGSYIPSLELNFISQFKSLISSLSTLSVENNLFPLLCHICTSDASNLYIFSKADYPYISNVLCKYPLSDLLLLLLDLYLWTLCGQCLSLETRVHGGWGLAYSGIGHLFTSPRMLLGCWKLIISNIWFTSESAISQNFSAHSVLWFVVLKMFAFYWHANAVFPHTKDPHLVEKN